MVNRMPQATNSIQPTLMKGAPCCANSIPGFIRQGSRSRVRQFCRAHLGKCGLLLFPVLSLEQVKTVCSGRFDAGFIVRMGTLGRELDQRPKARHRVVLAAPKGPPLRRSETVAAQDA